ncbi:hypothetical protein C8Q79DRAFT_924492 [Trametes meyenii]|nr:hypothetical protein C8Q79DRAFT_924492 [Trametes meyenii]
MPFLLHLWLEDDKIPSIKVVHDKPKDGQIKWSDIVWLQEKLQKMPDQLIEVWTLTESHWSVHRENVVLARVLGVERCAQFGTSLELLYDYLHLSSPLPFAQIDLRTPANGGREGRLIAWCFDGDDPIVYLVTLTDSNDAYLDKLPGLKTLLTDGGLEQVHVWADTNTEWRLHKVSQPIAFPARCNTVLVKRFDVLLTMGLGRELSAIESAQIPSMRGAFTLNSTGKKRERGLSVGAVQGGEGHDAERPVKVARGQGVVSAKEQVDVVTSLVSIVAAKEARASGEHVEGDGEGASQTTVATGDVGLDVEGATTAPEDVDPGAQGLASAGDVPGQVAVHLAAAADNDDNDDNDDGEDCAQGEPSSDSTIDYWKLCAEEGEGGKKVYDIRLGDSASNPIILISYRKSLILGGHASSAQSDRNNQDRNSGSPQLARGLTHRRRCGPSGRNHHLSHPSPHSPMMAPKDHFRAYNLYPSLRGESKSEFSPGLRKIVALYAGPKPLITSICEHKDEYKPASPRSWRHRLMYKKGFAGAWVMICPANRSHQVAQPGPTPAHLAAIEAFREAEIRCPGDEEYAWEAAYAAKRAYEEEHGRHLPSAVEIARQIAQDEAMARRLSQEGHMDVLPVTSRVEDNGGEGSSRGWGRYAGRLTHADRQIMADAAMARAMAQDEGLAQLPFANVGNSDVADRSLHDAEEDSEGEDVIIVDDVENLQEDDIARAERRAELDKNERNIALFFYEQVYQVLMDKKHQLLVKDYLIFEQFLALGLEFWDLRILGWNDLWAGVEINVPSYVRGVVLRIKGVRVCTDLGRVLNALENDIAKLGFYLADNHCKAPKLTILKELRIAEWGRPESYVRVVMWNKDGHNTCAYRKLPKSRVLKLSLVAGLKKFLGHDNVEVWDPVWSQWEHRDVDALEHLNPLTHTVLVRVPNTHRMPYLGTEMACLDMPFSATPDLNTTQGIPRKRARGEAY